ncbi:cell wall integrity and stress response component 1-like [Eucalyptus grandis]|uniref:cell wall integrity and stress response component 1-like n=1 Tax=Eucalyptus grandis TaxID=71139 RepID=UPI00192ED062|nr:cell wall integrity and stress response component 1-like [Eucalyptus grandis]
MESQKIIRLLALIFSLLMIEKSMATRILFVNYSPPPPDGDHGKSRVNGSTPVQDKHWSGDGSGQGTVLVPPPSTKATLSQDGTPNSSAKAAVDAPTNAKVNVSTAASPTSATSSAHVTSSGNTSSTKVTSGSTVSTSGHRSVSASSTSSSTVTKYP